jgi:hypothetical protein
MMFIGERPTLGLGLTWVVILIVVRYSRSIFFFTCGWKTKNRRSPGGRYARLIYRNPVQ